MLTIDKFRDAVTAHNRHSRASAWGAFAAGLVVLAASWFAVQSLTPPGDIRTYASLACLGGLVGVWAMTGLVGACLNEGWGSADPRLICPHCDGPIQLHSALVIATRNCPHCGRRVLAEPRPWA